jgi:hypothetical protein
MTGKTPANIAAGTTNGALVAAVAGKKIRVTSLVAVVGGTATNVTFLTKPAGTAVAISPLMALPINGVLVLPHNKDGWFETAAGDALVATTGAGSTVGFLIGYELI